MRGIYFLLAVGAAAASQSLSSKPCKNTKTITKGVSYTPSPTTKTKTITLTRTATVSVYKATKTFISTFTDTTYVPATDTVTVTTTTTTYNTVSTIPAPSGFIPIQSSLPNTSFEYPNIVQKRDVVLPIGEEEIVARAAQPAQPPKPSYCATKTLTVSRPLSRPTSTTTTTIYSVKSVTTTLGSTTTTDFVYDREHTVTSTLGKSTSFLTKTARGSSTSYYAACATNYFANNFNLFGVSELGLVRAAEESGKQDVNDPSQYAEFNVTSPYECCVASLTKTDNLSSAWYFAYDASVGTGDGPFSEDGTQCRVYLQPREACAATGQDTTDWAFGMYGNIDYSHGYVTGNGYCGKYTIAGFAL